MKKISSDLEKMLNSAEESEAINVVITTTGMKLTKSYGLKKIQGLDDLLSGNLTPGQIKSLVKDREVVYIEPDMEASAN